MIKKVESQWKFLEKKKGVSEEKTFPYVSIVIPTYNSAHSIALTLDSLLSQDYLKLQIVLIDGGSTDHTIKVIRNYNNSSIEIHTVSSDHPYEMINRGLSFVKGVYVNLLFPGDFYLSKNSLRWVMELTTGEQAPDLVYSAATLLFKDQEPFFLYRDFNKKNIADGKRPTIIQACWFRSDLFKKIGKFDPQYRIRSGYEFQCRVLKNGLNVASTTRAAVHFDVRSKTVGYLFRNFIEISRVIFQHFGLFATLKWMVRQKEMKKLFQYGAKKLQVALLGR